MAIFDDQGFLHVETPIMQAMPGADTHIHAFQHRKRSISAKQPRIRDEKAPRCRMPEYLSNLHRIPKEERTKLHNPEFTMLEWYRTGADYTDIMQDCVDLIRSLEINKFEYNDKTCNPHENWQKLSVVEAFQEYAEIDLSTSLHALCVQSMDHTDKPCDDAVKVFKQQAESINIRVAETDSWDDIFHAIMAEKIEPHLGQGAPTILYDYPASMAALSRKKPNDPRYAERFELYICGIELANAFSELTDAAEQRDRFEADMAEKQRLYDESYPIDEDFLEALEYGLP